MQHLRSVTEGDIIKKNWKMISELEATLSMADDRILRPCGTPLTSSGLEEKEARRPGLWLASNCA